jgi:DNA polymerase-1
MAKKQLFELYAPKAPNEKRMLIVDGHNLLFQMFFGIPARIAGTNGRIITGTIGFVSTLIKMINALDITHTLVVFDGEQHLNNKELDPNYKANRPDWSEVLPEDNPFSQLEDIEKTLEFLNISYIVSSNGLEADDYIYAITKKHQTEFDNIFLLSKDTDFYQILSKKVLMIKYAGANTKLISDNEVFEMLGIYPQHYAFFKALVGDTADNIKGIASIGKITARNIINSYKSIPQLFDNLSNLSPKLQNALKEQRRTLENNLKLITFDDFTLADISLESLMLSQNFESANAGSILRQLNIL